MILCLVLILVSFGTTNLFGYENDEAAIVEVDDLTGLSGVYLQNDIIIRAANPDFDILVTNIAGNGNIIIDADYDGRILFNNVHIEGNIIIKDASGFVDLTLNNSNISAIVFDGTGRANTTLLALAAEDAHLQNVVINTTGVHLLGDFGRIDSNIHEGLIYLQGNIVGLYAVGNIVLVGSGDISYTVTPIGIMAEIFDPLNQTQGLVEELTAAIDALLHQYFSRFELSLLEGLWNIFSNLNWPSFSFAPAQLPQTTPRPTQTPQVPILTPPPSPQPSSGPGFPDGGFTPPVGDPVSIININITPPSLTASVQRSISGDGFVGIITWFDEHDNEFTGNEFVPNTTYIARITLISTSNRFFVDGISSNIHISLADGGGYDRTILTETRNNVVLTLKFNATSKVLAQRFVLRDIQGSFDHVYVETHYLGTLTTDNFRVHFGSNPTIPNISDHVSVINVSPYSHSGGYYVLTLDTLDEKLWQPSDVSNYRLTVEMRGDLDYYMLYTAPVYTIPEYVPSSITQPNNDPVLISSIVIAGESASIINFPNDTNYAILVSSVEIPSFDHWFAITVIFEQARQVMLSSLANPTNQSFVVPINSHLGTNTIYLVSMAGEYIIPVGNIYVEAANNSLILGGFGFAVDFDVKETAPIIVQPGGNNQGGRDDEEEGDSEEDIEPDTEDKEPETREDGNVEDEVMSFE